MSTKERIKEVRLTLGLTQSKFAERIAISTSYITGMERGDKRISERTIKQISMEFGVSEHWLRTGEGEMYNEEEEVYLAKANSLFKSLNPEYRAFALAQLDGLVGLQTVSNA